MNDTALRIALDDPGDATSADNILLSGGRLFTCVIIQQTVPHVSRTDCSRDASSSTAWLRTEDLYETCMSALLMAGAVGAVIFCLGSCLVSWASHAAASL